VSKKSTPRSLKRLYDRRQELLDRLKADYQAQPKASGVAQPKEMSAAAPVVTYPCGTPIRK